MFDETFEAHNAFKNVKALRKMIFESQLELSEEIIVNNSEPISCEFALQDVHYLDRRRDNPKSPEHKLYNPTGDGVITKSRAVKIAGSGLSYDDLAKLFIKFGKAGLVSILFKSPSTMNDPTQPRGTKTKGILAAIQRHFEDKVAARRHEE